MDNSATNEAALNAHREAFYVALQQHFDAIDDKKIKIKSRAEYEELISFLKSPGCKDKNTRKTKNQYYAMRHYIVMKGNAIGQRDYLVSKIELDKARDAFGDVDALKVRRMAATDDLFDIIREHHLLKDHSGKRITWESVKECYSNISRDVCGLYCALCQCTVNQRLPGRPEGIKPILSKTFNDRGQMDLIDMQSNMYDGFTWILHYQDHLTKFSYLRALQNKRVSNTCPTFIFKTEKKKKLTKLLGCYCRDGAHLHLWYPRCPDDSPVGQWP
jgi:hypothetical protein